MSALLEAREPVAKYLSTLPPPLVEQFELMATAPGGVAKLRELILTLAVQGKLMPQAPTDESAHETLMRVAEERESLVKTGVIKTTKRSTEISDRKVPFTIPASWAWVPLADIVRVLNGRAYSKQELLDRGPTPVLRVGNLFTSNHWYYSDLELGPEKLCKPGDLLFAWSASFGPFIWDGPVAIFHYHIWKLDPVAPERFNSNYLYTFLLEKTAEIKAAGHGVSMVHMTKEKMEQILVPWPPLAEQTRIVTRVEELMRLCDALEARGQLEAAQHAQLVQTLLGALTASTSPEELADNWQRVATHFDLLLDRPEAIDALEQTILQLAVRGLLVPQNPKDEPASKLLKKIRIEKDRLIADGKIKQDKPLADITVEEKPFEAPESWEWVRLGEVVSISSGVTLGRKTALSAPASYPYLRVANVQRWHLNLNSMKEVVIDRAELARFQLVKGDLLITEGGDWDKVGRTTIWRDELPVCLHQNHVFKARGTNAGWDPIWAELYLNSTFARAYFASSAKQTTNLASINMTQLKGCCFPLPPLAEQARIVARVAYMRRLCADLRQRLAARQTTQAHLAEALIDEVA